MNAADGAGTVDGSAVGTDGADESGGDGEPSGAGERGTPEPPMVGTMTVVAANLAVIVATVHLVLGLWNWYRYARVDILWPPDLRWPLFVLSGAAMLLGVALVARGAPRRPIYAVGVGLMATYIVGYFWFHVGGHALPFTSGPRTHHDGSLPVLVVDHVAQVEPYVQLTLAAELLLLVGLLALIAVEPLRE